MFLSDFASASQNEIGAVLRRDFHLVAQVVERNNRQIRKSLLNIRVFAGSGETAQENDFSPSIVLKVDTRGIDATGKIGVT